MSQYYNGHLLIASRFLRDPNFHRSVVALIEHNEGGAMGLVVNRPTSVSIHKALEGHFDLPETDSTVFYGGPVERSALFILHNSSEYNGNEFPVLRGLFMGSSAEVFEQVVRLAETGDPKIKFRIFAGCAGWAPNQLEMEIDRGDWHIKKATLEDIFGEQPAEQWGKIIEELASRFPFPEGPRNPEDN